MVAHEQQHGDEQHRPTPSRPPAAGPAGGRRRRPSAAARSAVARSSRWIITRPRPLSSATPAGSAGRRTARSWRTARCATSEQAEIGQPDVEQRRVSSCSWFASTSTSAAVTMTAANASSTSSMLRPVGSGQPCRRARGPPLRSPARCVGAPAISSPLHSHARFGAPGGAGWCRRSGWRRVRVGGGRGGRCGAAGALGRTAASAGGAPTAAETDGAGRSMRAAQVVDRGVGAAEAVVGAGCRRRPCCGRLGRSVKRDVGAARPRRAAAGRAPRRGRPGRSRPGRCRRRRSTAGCTHSRASVATSGQHRSAGRRCPAPAVSPRGGRRALGRGVDARGSGAGQRGGRRAGGRRVGRRAARRGRRPPAPATIGASSPKSTSMTSATMQVTLSGPPPRRASSMSRSAHSRGSGRCAASPPASRADHAGKAVAAEQVAVAGRASRMVSDGSMSCR